jgi:hypothetical protein
MRQLVEGHVWQISAREQATRVEVHVAARRMRLHRTLPRCRRVFYDVWGDSHP